MNRCVSTLGVGVVMSALACSALAERPADFGDQWVRSRPFHTTTWIDYEPIDVAAFQASGIRSGFVYTPLYGTETPTALSNAGIPFLFNYHLTGPLEARYHFIEQQIAVIPGFEGLSIRDEPNRAQMETMAPVFDHFRTALPNALLYVNAHPDTSVDARWGNFGGAPNPNYTYDQYLEDILTILRPDALSFDYHLLNSNNATQFNFGLFQTWTKHLVKVRAKAMEHNVPYFVYASTFATTGGQFRLASESDLKMQVFSALAFGYKGVQYFTWDSHATEGTISNAILQPDGSPSSVFAHVQGINRQLDVLGPTLRHLTSTDVRFIRGRAITNNPTPEHMTNWSFNAGGDPNILGIAVQGSGRERNGIIGFFEDPNGETYFMLVNTNHRGNATSAQTAVTFRLTFAASVTELFRLNPFTGEIETIHLSGPLDWTLGGGQGDLFKYGSGVFYVPEPAGVTILGLAMIALTLRGRRGGRHAGL